MAQAKIGRIRLKSGGAEIRLFEREPDRPIEKEMRRHVGLLIHEDSPLSGFAIATVYEDGSVDFGFMRHRDCKVPEEMFPSLMADICRNRVFGSDDD